jgi:hypothetical protein
MIFQAAALGAGLWGVFAVGIRQMHALGAFEDRALPVTFVAGALSTIPLVDLSMKALGVHRASDIVPAVCAASAAAMILDGFAITWFPQLVYGARRERLTVVGAWLLWGVGWSFVYALYRAH